MSLVWSIDPEKRLMTAIAAGEVTRADVEAFFEETTAAGAAACYKLFDGSAIETTLDPEDMLALGVRMRSLYQPGSEMGPLAIVLPLHVMELAHRMVGILAVADRPMRVFIEVEAARTWLEEKGCALHQPKTAKRGPPRKR